VKKPRGPNHARVVPAAVRFSNRCLFVGTFTTSMSVGVLVLAISTLGRPWWVEACLALFTAVVGVTLTVLTLALCNYKNEPAQPRHSQHTSLLAEAKATCQKLDGASDKVFAKAFAYVNIGIFTGLIAASVEFAILAHLS